ncbi:MAG: hypothetical protein ACRDRS_17090 [Pseudonocardiaceae bacterium]
MRAYRFLPCVLGLTLLAVASCSGGAAAEDPGPVFDSEGGRTVTCMAHQPAAPGNRYTDPQLRDTAQVLTVLHYYTANGSKRYCDGQPPSAVDRRWAQLYVDLGADPAAVARLLPAR